MNEEEHKNWLSRNRHLLSFGHILALGEKLTKEEQDSLDKWYETDRA
jgi:hypothetical protein